MRSRSTLTALGSLLAMLASACAEQGLANLGDATDMRSPGDLVVAPDDLAAQGDDLEVPPDDLAALPDLVAGPDLWVLGLCQGIAVAPYPVVIPAGPKATPFTFKNTGVDTINIVTVNLEGPFDIGLDVDLQNLPFSLPPDFSWILSLRYGPDGVNTRGTLAIDFVGRGGCRLRIPLIGQ